MIKGKWTQVVNVVSLSHISRQALAAAKLEWMEKKLEPCDRPRPQKPQGARG